MIKTTKAKFRVGQVIYHRIFNYRGVILDVDPSYQNDDVLYELMAKTKPPKDKPWYLILVDGADYMAYVAEQHLEMDDSGLPISHPSLDTYFEMSKDGIYVSKQRYN